jgi:hypothetical protein
MIKAIKKINQYWDEINPLRRSIVTGSSLLLGLVATNKIVLFIIISIIFCQRIIFNANGLEKTEKVIKNTFDHLKKDKENEEYPVV